MTINDYKAAAIRTAITHALFHRREAGRFAVNLIDRLRWAAAKGKTAFLTVTDMAKSRNGTLHRNTDREMLRECERLGFIRLFDYSPGRPATEDVAGSGFKPYRVIVRITAVFAYLQRFNLRPQAHNSDAMARPAGEYPTKAAWEARQAAWAAEQARQAAQARAAAEQARQDQLAASRAARAADQAAAVAPHGATFWRNAIAKLETAGQAVPAWFRRKLSDAMRAEAAAGVQS